MSEKGMIEKHILALESRVEELSNVVKTLAEAAFKDESNDSDTRSFLLEYLRKLEGRKPPHLRKHVGTAQG